MQSLYNYNDMAAEMGGIPASDLIKAMEAGLMTGMQYVGTDNNGGSLKIESLDPVLKVLGNRYDQLVFLRSLPKQKISSTVHQYNQLVKYGQNVGIFNTEGETPQETDSVYRRKAILTKFMGVSGSVTQPAMLVQNAGNIQMYSQEVQNKTLYLQTQIDSHLITADSSKIEEQFDGVFRQHFESINDLSGGLIGKTSEQALDTYYKSLSVIDVHGAVFNEKVMQQASDVIVNVYNGYVDRVISNPIVFADYVQTYQDSKRILVGASNSVTGATMGQSVNNIQTQFGLAKIENDRFFDERTPIKIGATATSAAAPAAPVADATTPVAAQAADTKTNFTQHAGTYSYMVTAKNRFGESAPTRLGTTPLAVAATASVNLKFTAGTGAYATKCFVIYRTEANVTDITTANFYPIFEVSVTEQTSGYDGGVAGIVRDRNRIIAGTKSALVWYNDNQIMDYIELMATSKIDYAITAPQRRFSVLSYATPCIYQGAKLVRIINIGRPV